MAASSFQISVNAIGDTTVVPGVAGQTIYVLGFYMDAALAISPSFRDGMGGATISGPWPMITGVPQSVSPDAIRFQCSAGNPLVIHCPLAVQISGFIEYNQS